MPKLHLVPLKLDVKLRPDSHGRIFSMTLTGSLVRRPNPKRRRRRRSPK